MPQLTDSIQILILQCGQDNIKYVSILYAYQSDERWTGHQTGEDTTCSKKDGRDERNDERQNSRTCLERRHPKEIHIVQVITKSQGSV